MAAVFNLHVSTAFQNTGRGSMSDILRQSNERSQTLSLGNKLVHASFYTPPPHLPARLSSKFTIYLRMRIKFVHSCIHVDFKRDLDSNRNHCWSGGGRPSRPKCISLINYVFLCSIFNTTTCTTIVGHAKYQ